MGGIQDGHGEKVQESLKQVHYDYKNLLGGMMRKFSWMLLVLLAFSVYAEDEKEVGGGSVKGKKKPFLAASLSSGICRWNFSASRYGADL